MHLKSLELSGFKSFADKTVLDFHEGITAIVGPNGCGKSNVLDAVRWVLGEQSAKSLRGDEMADVIFNGSETRKPHGVAEVSLTLSDCEKDLGIEWHEVRVTRRVYRDGNSEYFLNKMPCRLRDIQNLFADTGVARAAYSMMEQGRIDMILSSRPEDRRAVFEEAAGITKYKAQKREALRKLEATEANLLRIGDVIKEVKRQIGSLQRQAGKARRYQALHSDLRVLETHQARKQLDSLKSELAACGREIERLAASEEATRAAIEENENALALERRELDRIDLAIAESRGEVQRLETDIATHRSRIEFNRQRAQEFAELIERAQREIAEAEEKRSQHAGEIEKSNNAIAELERYLNAVENDLTELTHKADHLQKHRTERDARLRELQLAFSKSESRSSAMEAEIAATKTRRDLTDAQAKQLAGEIRAATEAQQKLLARITASLQIGDRKPTSIEATVRAAEQRLADAEQELVAIERALAEKRSRLDVLRQLNDEGEGLAQGSQAVLKQLGDSEKLREAIVGPLVAQLEVQTRFIPAIEAALGRNLHAIILKNASVASEIITHLREKKLGQAALLISEWSRNTEQQRPTVLPRNAIGWASEKVSAPPALEALVKQMLGNVAIFPDLAAALQCKQQEPELAMATLAGEFLSAKGVVFGGCSEKRAASLLERKAQITELAREEAALAAKRDALRAERDEVKQALEAAAQFQREFNDLERKIDSLNSERSALERQVAAADSRIAQLEGELQAIRSRLEREQSELSQFESAQKEGTLREEEVSGKIQQLRVALAAGQQRHENLVAQRESLRAREAELIELIGVRQADITMYEHKLAAQAGQSRESEALIENWTREREKAQQTAAMTAEQRGARLTAMAKREADLRQLRDSLGELQNSRAQQQVRQSQLQMKMDNLAGHIARSYQVNLDSFVPDEAAFEKTLRAHLKRKSERTAPAETGSAEEGPPDLEQLIADLRSQLDNMGPVNLDAVHEYDELEERHKFLEAQNNDLTAARRELLDVISQINSTTRKLFAETFEQVRKNFREMFVELFGGGRADLSLLDENDPLNSGIEITAKPPGKQLQSVSLLSGGERAMTAVALLFAIYMVRPSPFCILDEVDAPLDESNINCFTRVLDRFVGQSQFIIITHNKRTIAKADVLYGVTMEERGVSKLVGMKLVAPPHAASSTTWNQAEKERQQRHLALATR
jgi:chromosome segregation protein